MFHLNLLRCCGLVECKCNNQSQGKQQKAVAVTRARDWTLASVKEGLVMSQ